MAEAASKGPGNEVTLPTEGAGDEMTLPSEEEVDEIDKLAKAVKLAKKMNLSLKGLKGLNDIKHRLKLHLLEKAGKSRKPGEVINMVTEMRSRDEERREHLLGLLQEVEKRAMGLMMMKQELDDQLADQLDRNVPNFMAKFKLHKERMTSRKCPILVAGETSAGKSSLINLLLDEEVLPTSHLSNTYTICEIRYGDVRTIKLHRRDGTCEDRVLEEGDSLVDLLKKYVEEKGDRDQPTDYPRVEILLPREFLKDIYIVDSPGIGEKEEITKQVKEYLTEAFAFIYVIKSDNAGGVQTDRLQALLKEVATMKTSGTEDIPAFSVKTAIFVCNKWDQVPIAERKLVKEDTIRKLQACWSGSSDRQVFCMSTAEAQRLRDQGHVSADFSRFLDGLERLIPESLNWRIEVSYRWLDYFLSRTIYHLRAYVQQGEQSRDERKAKFELVKSRLHALGDQADDVMKMLRSNVDSCVDVAMQSLREHLTSDQVKRTVTTWTEADLPKVEGTLNIMVKKIKTAISQRIQGVLSDWEKDQAFFSRQREVLIELFATAFRTKIERNLLDIEGTIDGTAVVPMEPAADCGVEEEEETTDQKRSKLPQLFIEPHLRLNTAGKVTLGVTSPIWLPIGVVAAFFGLSVYGIVELKRIVERSREDKEVNTYQQDKYGYLSRMALKELEQFVRSNELRDYVRSQLKPAYYCLEQLQEVVPKQIQLDLDLVRDLNEDARDEKVYTIYYSPLLQVMDNFHRRLKAFWVQELWAPDIDPQTVAFATRDVYEGPICSGLRAELKRGELLPQEVGSAGAKPVTIKLFRGKITHRNVMEFLQEEDIFRKVKKHLNLIHLTGFSRIGHLPCLVFTPVVTDLRTRISDIHQSALMKNAYAPYDVLLGTMMQVVNGLEYLHSKGLVHLDLSLSTVAVDSDNVVKLTNIGKPREASLPHQGSFDTTEAGGYVYLAPEVLRGQDYVTESDMYAVGLMMWEICYTGTAYVDEDIRTFSELKDFVCSNRRPKTPEDPSEGAYIREPRDYNKWTAVMACCWASEPESRLTASCWKENINKTGDSRSSSRLSFHDEHFQANYVVL
ncbi:FGFR4 [Branchiostoma lanceolatum]|uniref:FGFR4 protein n=1 Tax=Branchiostoma lanceolatum TaxID=7740 RepID=A0A8K0EL54_BRALA|nr:FGFR4 [Branchiostoma lanceolatum]CAH1255338.1 FGFR4 [Branchiostoma lanceolatum]